MSRKLIISLISGVVLILLVIIFFLSNNKNKAPGEPLKAITTDAGFIIQVNDLQKIKKEFNNSSVWNELRRIGVFGKINGQLIFLDSLFKDNQDIRQVLNNPFYISGHVTGSGNVNFLHITKVPANFSEKKIPELIKFLVVNSGTISSRKYEGRNIFDVKLLNQQKIGNFSFTISNGLFILSFSSILVEDAIRQYLNGESVLSDKTFIEAYNTAGKNVPANVFINFRYLPHLISSQINAKLRPQIRGYDNFASWAELDLNMNSDILLLNGFTVTDGASQQLLKLFRNQSPRRIAVDNIWPSGISAFMTISLSSMNDYFENYKKYLLDNGRINEFQMNAALIKTKFNIDIADSFYDLLEGEFSLAIKPVKSIGEESDYYIALKVKSQSHAENKLNDALKRIARANAVSPDTYKYKYKIDNELSYFIYKWPLNKFLKQFLGNFFDVFDQPYFTIIDNYLVFGSSVKSLSELIHDNVLSRTLITDIAYRDYKNNISPKSNLSFYADLSRSPMNFSKYLLPEIIKGWENNIQVFQKLQVFGLQMDAGNSMMYTNLFLKSVPEYKDKPRTVWESLLDTTIDFKPQFVINHNTKQTEIFLQDMSNNIYLMNQAGRILWKQNLNEKINSTVYQVDYYKNGKLQLLFSTVNYLHLIDRNGNYVERYPVKLRSPATNGVALFDYEKNKNYRLFIACEDKKIYAYTIDGSLVKGWHFGKSEEIVNQPVNHFQVENKDYIVFGDRLKTYILDRRGSDRVVVNELIPKSENNNYQLDDRGTVKNSRIERVHSRAKIFQRDRRMEVLCSDR